MRVRTLMRPGQGISASWAIVPPYACLAGLVSGTVRTGRNSFTKAGSYFLQPCQFLFGIPILDILALVVFPFTPGKGDFELGQAPLVYK
jgi:hypothetical protein